MYTIAGISILFHRRGLVHAGIMYQDVEDHYLIESLFQDLLEQAYLEALIDGEQQSLA